MQNTALSLCFHQRGDYSNVSVLRSADNLNRVLVCRDLVCWGNSGSEFGDPIYLSEG